MNILILLYLKIGAKIKLYAITRVQELQGIVEYKFIL